MPESIIWKRAALGYTPPDLVSTFVFPEPEAMEGSPIEVKRHGKEMFKRYHTRRAELAASNRAGGEKSDYITLKLVPRDFVAMVDRDHTASTTLQDEIDRLPILAKYRVLLDAECENAERLFDADSYPTGHKIALSGTDQFSDYTNSEPITVIDEAMYVVKSKIGKKPNRLLLPEDVFQVLKWHPHLTIKSVLTGDTTAATLEHLQERFGIEKIILAGSLALDEATNAFSQIWSKGIFLGYINPNPQPSTLEMSWGYRLRQRGFPTVDNDVEGIDKANIEARRYKDKFDDVVVCAEAGYYIQNAIA